MTRHRAAALVPIVIAFALVLVAAGWWLSRDDDQDYPGSFYIEVAVRVADESGEGLISSETASREPIGSLVRYWYRDPAHWRMEIESGPLGQPPNRRGLYVSDGERIVLHDIEDGTYRVVPFTPDGPPGDGSWLPFISVLVGAAPGRSEAGLLEFLRERTGDDGSVEIVGEDTVLGRTTTRIEYAPIAMEQTNNDPPRGVGTGVLSFDPDSGFVLRSEAINDRAFFYLAEVRELRLPDDAPDSTFEFTPPPGAVEATPEG